MPPDPPAFAPQRILEVLARHEVLCVVIGGYAAVLAGVDVVTRDVDITPALDPENLQRLATALEELHAGIRVLDEPPVPLPTDPRLLARAQIWNLATDAGDLDITARDPTAPRATKICAAAPTAKNSPMACTSPSLRCKTSSAARRRRAERRISPHCRCYAPRSRQQP